MFVTVAVTLFGLDIVSLRTGLALHLVFYVSSAIFDLNRHILDLVGLALADFSDSLQSFHRISSAMNVAAHGQLAFADLPQVEVVQCDFITALLHFCDQLRLVDVAGGSFHKHKNAVSDEGFALDDN